MGKLPQGRRVEERRMARVHGPAHLLANRPLKNWRAGPGSATLSGSDDQQ